MIRKFLTKKKIASTVLAVTLAVTGGVTLPTAGLTADAATYQVTASTFPYNLATGNVTITDDAVDPNVHYKNYTDTGLRVTCYDYGVLTKVDSRTGAATFDSFRLQDFQMMPAKSVATVNYPVDYTYGRTEYSSYINEVFALVPQNVLTMLARNNVNIHVVSPANKSLFSGFYYDNVTGYYTESTQTKVTKRGKKVIKTETTTTRDLYVEDSAWTALAHEIGHAIDSELGMFSETENFEAIYLMFGKSFGSYGASDQSEFFAELYMQYLVNGTMLAKYYPALYQYMDAVTAMVQ